MRPWRKHRRNVFLSTWRQSSLRSLWEAIFEVLVISILSIWQFRRKCANLFGRKKRRRQLAREVGRIRGWDWFPMAPAAWIFQPYLDFLDSNSTPPPSLHLPGTPQPQFRGDLICSLAFVWSGASWKYGTVIDHFPFTMFNTIILSWSC